MATKKTGIEGVHIVKKVLASGTIRWYMFAWRGGVQIRTQDGQDRPKVTQADIIAIGAALIDSGRAAKGTLERLIQDYRSPITNPEWSRLQPATKKLWNNCLDKISARFGETPLSWWNSPAMLKKVMEWRAEMRHAPRSADEHIANLSRVLTYGRFNADLVINVAQGIPHLYRGKNRADIIWETQDLQNLKAVARQAVWDGVRLAYMTGLRREDLINLRLDEIGQFALTHTADKISKGRRYKVTMPVLPCLRELINELKDRKRNTGVNTVLVNSDGNAWTGGGFSSSFSEDRNAANISYIDEHGQRHWKRLHDLRGTFATVLMTQAKPALTDQQIATIMGWSVDQVSDIRRRYVDTASIIRAIGEQMQNGFVNQGVNQTGANPRKPLQKRV